MTKPYCAACTERAVVVAIPAKAGAVEGKTENSDAFIWQLFTEFTAPAVKGNLSLVVFETWASDKDTIATKPPWPEAGEPMDLHASVLGIIKTLDPAVKTLCSSAEIRLDIIKVGVKFIW